MYKTNSWLFELEIIATRTKAVDHRETSKGTLTRIDRGTGNYTRCTESKAKELSQNNANYSKKDC